MFLYLEARTVWFQADTNAILFLQLDSCSAGRQHLPCGHRYPKHNKQLTASWNYQTIENRQQNFQLKPGCTKNRQQSMHSSEQQPAIQINPEHTHYPLDIT